MSCIPISSIKLHLSNLWKSFFTESEENPIQLYQPVKQVDTEPSRILPPIHQHMDTPVETQPNLESLKIKEEEIKSSFVII